MSRGWQYRRDVHRCSSCGQWSVQVYEEMGRQPELEIDCAFNSRPWYEVVVEEYVC